MFLFDKLKLESQRVYTDEGYLVVPARISRTGIQEYYAGELELEDKSPTDKVRVYRPPEEVFNGSSLKSFGNKPVTDDHPPELVSAKNAKKYAVGMSTGDVTRDGDFIKTVLHITDSDAINSIESGKVELSNGYTTDLEWKSGETEEGETFDAIQRNIRGNHIAIVKKGRAGAQCKLADKEPEDAEMDKWVIDGVEYKTKEELSAAVAKLKADLKDAQEGKEQKEGEEESDNDQKKGEPEEEDDTVSKKEVDTLKAKLDDALSKVPTIDKIDEMIKDRTIVVDSVKKLCPDIDWNGKGSDQLKREVVGKMCPQVKLDSVSVDYINARFDALLEDVDNNSQHWLDVAIAKQVSVGDTKEVADNRPADVIAREKMVINSRNAWKRTGE